MNTFISISRKFCSITSIFTLLLSQISYVPLTFAIEEAPLEIQNDDASTEEKTENIIFESSEETVPETELEETLEENEENNPEETTLVKEESVETNNEVPSLEESEGTREIVDTEEQMEEETLPLDIPPEEENTTYIAQSVQALVDLAQEGKIIPQMDSSGVVTAARFERDVAYQVGNLRAYLPEQVTVSTADHTAFDLAALNFQELPSGEIQSIDPSAKKIVDFGIPGQHLIFSHPVQLALPVDFPDGYLVNIRVKHEGDTEFSTQGITTNPNATCTDGISSDESNAVQVQNGEITFYTCGASEFSVVSNLVDFNNTSDLTTLFDDDGTPVFTNISNGGIDDSGSIDVPLGSNDLWTTKQGYSVTGAGNIYRFSAYFKIKDNNGRGGLGFSTPDAVAGGVYATPTKGIGATFHGNGGEFMNNGSVLQTLTWYPILAIGNWYWIQFEVTAKGSNTYDLNLQIWNTDSTGTIGTMNTEKTYTDLINSDVGSASIIHTFFSADGSRMEKIDNYSIELEGGASFVETGAPVVTTTAVTNITDTTADSGGEVTDDQGASITARGVCWSTSQNPTTADNCTSDGTNTGIFTSTISGLTPETLYYVRSYATNSEGTSYGGERSFTTDLPSYQAPGGVIDHLQLWLNSETGVFSDRSGNQAGSTPATDGQVAQSWADQSGARTNDATDADTSITGPTYRTNNALNFHPRLDFSGASVGYTLGNDYLFSNTDGLAIIAVARSNLTSSGIPFLYDFGLHGNTNQYIVLSPVGISARGPYNFGGVGADYTYSATASDQPLIINSNHIFSDQNQLYVNGELVASPAIPSLSQITATEIAEGPTRTTGSAPVTIGVQAKNYDSANRSFEGNVFEMLVYDKNIATGINRQQVESYLALKYGISLDQTSATDYLASNGTTKMWDSSVNTSYNQDIFGIGQDSVSTLDQKISHSANPDGIITLATTNDFTSLSSDESRTSLENRNFQTIANNNGEALWTATEAPEGYEILERKWQAQETGTVGNISLQFDVADSDFNVPDLLLGTEYYIIVDSDNDGDLSDETPTALTNTSGDLWSASVDFADNAIFTLATEASSVGTATSPFSSLSQAYAAPYSGRYYFDLGSGLFQADVDTSEGGGWVLILQYLHQGGTNPNLNTIGATSDLPITTTNSLGTDESGDLTRWGHTGNAAVAQFTDATEFRFYSITNQNPRVTHFSTPVGINYAKTGTGGFSGLTSNFTPLSGHTGSLPAAAQSYTINQGDGALTEFPFWMAGTYHWAIRGQEFRWESDNYPNNSNYDTLHRVWVRAEHTPGGVKDNLQIWLKADDNGGVSTNGASITTWDNLAGANFTDASGALTYQNNASYWLNFNPVINFNGINTFLNNTSNFGLTGLEATIYTVIGAFTGDTPLNGYHAFMGYNGTPDQNYGLEFVMQESLDQVRFKRFSEVGDIANKNITRSEPGIFGASRDGSGQGRFHYNGATTLGSIIAGNWNANVHYYIGAEHNYGILKGTMPELLLFNRYLSDAERNRVESYLALKYGKTLDQTLAQDYIASDGITKMWDSSVNTSYNQDIFGIGRDNTSALDQKISKSVNTDGILTLATTNDFASANNNVGRTSLENFHFQTIANNSGNATWTESGAPTGYEILERKWQAQETGTVGNVSLQFDVADSDFNVPDLLLGTEYYIIVDNDNDGDLSDETPTALTNTSGELWSTSVDFADNAIFTLATKVSSVGTIDSPFTSLLDAYNAPSSGRYYFNLGSGLFQADVDTSEGGGWVLILQYSHDGGTNPNLNVIGATSDLPITTTDALGTDQSGDLTRWGHAGNAAVAQFTDATELRFYSITNANSRVMHFSTPIGLDYAKTGTGDFTGINSNFTPLSGHTAYLPSATEDYFTDQGDLALTEFPFWLDGTYHWGIRGYESRWESDNFLNNYNYDTLHQVWTRATRAPGGVKTDNLWLRADTGTSCTTQDCLLDSWADQSSAGNDGTSSGENRPSYNIETNTNAINFHPTLSFNNSRVDTTIPVFASGILHDNVNMYGVFINDSTDDFDWFVYQSAFPYRETVSWNFEGSSDMDIDFGDFFGGDRLSAPFSSTIGVGIPHMLSLNNSSAIISDSNKQIARVDGKQIGANTTFNGINSTSSGVLQIGDNGLVDDSQYSPWEGKLAELIFLNKSLTAGERQQVESYLALKYGISLDQTSATDYLASNGTTKMWDSSVNASYNQDIFGIGRDDVSILDQKVSESQNSDNILILATTNDFTSANNDSGRTSLNDLHFQTIANNDGGASWTGTNAPTGYEILERKWQAQETGTVGNVSLQFDVADSDFDVPDLLFGSEYYLVVDSDDDGDLSDETPTALTNTSGDLWSASVDFADNAIFTLATEENSINQQFQFLGNLDSITADNTLTNVDYAGESSESTFVQETFTQCSNASRSVYFVAQDAGLLFNDGLGSELTDYTISLWFKLDNYEDGWARLFDVKNGTVDNGIYRNGDDLYFYPDGTVGSSLLAGSDYKYLTLSRDGTTSQIKVYINGTLATTYDDSSNDYYSIDSSGNLIFIRDNNSGSAQHENYPARIAYISVSNRVKSDAEILAEANNICTSAIPDNNAPTDLQIDGSNTDSIQEGNSIGDAIGSLTTTDADSGDTHTYSLSCTTAGADDSSFQISGDTLQANAVFDYENPVDANTDNSYEVCIRTNDGKGGLFDKNLSITVTNLFEGPVACSSTSLSVTQTSFDEFTIDESVSPLLNSAYVSYGIDAGASGAFDDLWVKADSFSDTSKLNLAPNEDGIYHVGALANNGQSNAYFYLTGSETNTEQTYTITLYEGNPDLGGTAVCTEDVSHSKVVDQIKANANKVNSVVTSAPFLGGEMTMVVKGVTGSMSSTRPELGVFSYSPASLAAWPADCLELKDTQMELSGGNTGTYTHGLVITNLNSATTNYTLTYTFRVACVTSDDTPLSPINFISSGNTNLKHTDVDTIAYQSIPPVEPAENRVYMTVSSDPDFLVGGGSTTYTVTIYNESPLSVTLDHLKATLASSPATLSYVSHSSDFDGNTVSEPYTSGQTLTWSWEFTVPANDSKTFTFDANVPATDGLYTTSLVGFVGDTQIDQTMGTTDSVPAQFSLGVGNVTLSGSSKTVSDLNGGFVEPGDVLQYTISIQNDGSVDATGVDVNDTIDSNLENLSNVTIGVNSSSCGSSYTNSSSTTALQITDLEITAGSHCDLTFEATVKSSVENQTNILNTATISTPAEGGAGGAPSTTPLTVTLFPHLSVTQTDSDTDDLVLPGETITYTTTIRNDGDTTATGVDISDLFSGSVGSIDNITFSHCGIHFSNASSGLSVDIANLEIAVGTDCVVSYDMNVSETAVYGETISSTTDISSANEGGNDPDSFDADTLTVTTIGTIGFTISKTNLTIPENGGTGTFTIVLDGKPSSNVVIALTANNTSEATVSPSTVTFTPANWDTVQTVVVTGVNDFFDANDTAVITASVNDELSANEFDSVENQTVAITLTDDDTAGIAVNVTDNLSGEDGDTATFTMTLTSQPTADVTVALSSSDTTEGTVASSVTLSAANWNLPQVVTVTGVDDVLSDGAKSFSIVTGNVTSSDAVYNAFNGSTITDPTITNQDNDAPGIMMTVTDSTTGENGTTATLRFQLAAQPDNGANVTIPLSVSDTTEASVPSSITILNANWNVPANNVVTVTGVDDALLDGDISFTLITGDPVSSDSGFNALTAASIADPRLTNSDDESLTVAFSEATFSGDEDDNAHLPTLTISGAQTLEAKTIQIVLDEASTATLADNDFVFGSPATFTIPTGNYTTPTTLSITGLSIVSDSFEEDDETIILNLQNSDSEITLGTQTSTTYTITNDDTIGVQVHVLDNTTSESGNTGTVQFSLTSEPRGNVTIALSSDNTSEVSTPESVTILVENWNIPSANTITLSGENDVITDGNQMANIITGNVTSTDSRYNALDGSTIADIAIRNIDDDSAGILVTALDTTTDENGGTATVQFELTSQPSGGADVTIPLSLSDTTEASVPSSITIANENWNIPANNVVTITGIDDALFDGDIVFALQTGDPSSSDTAFNALEEEDVADLNFTNHDLDQITVSFSASSSSESESGTADLPTLVVSGAETLAPLTVQLLSTGGTATPEIDFTLASPTLITIPASDYSEPQTLSLSELTILNDVDVEDDETIFLQLQNPSDDLTLGTQKTTIHTIENDDTAQISAHVLDGVVAENPADNGVLQILLDKKNETSNPFVIHYDVSGTATAGADYAPLSGEVSIASGEQEALVTIDTTGFDDNEIEGFETVTITLTSSSSSLATLSSTQKSAAVRITDDEDADGDGSDSSVEDSANNNGDGNGDGIPDSEQSNVTSAPNPATGSSFTVELDGICSVVSSAAGMSESDLTDDPEYQYPVGLSQFRIQCDNPGDTAHVTIYYDKIYDTSNWEVRKYNPFTNAYSDLDVVTTVTVAPHDLDNGVLQGTQVTTIEYDVVDGSELDHDAAIPLFDGIIFDPVGPGIASSSSSTTSSGGGGGGGSRKSTALSYSDSSDQSTKDTKTSENILSTMSNEGQCLYYDPTRDLRFLDVHSNTQYASAINTLKDTFLIDGNDERQYVISGYSGTQKNNTAIIGPKQSLRRFELMKIMLISHCLPILSLSDIPSKTITGERMPIFVDLLRTQYNQQTEAMKEVYNIVYSAAYYGFVEGTANLHANAFEPASTAEAVKMTVELGRLRNEHPDTSVNVSSLRHMRSQWYYETYILAAQLGLLDAFNGWQANPLTPHEPILRAQSFAGLLNALQKRGLYQDDIEEEE